MASDRSDSNDDDATLGPSHDGGPERVGRTQAKLGDTIGRYVLLRPIASGGMGFVWAAWDPELDRNVALKLLLPRRNSTEEREALAREARSLARLSHPNVVQVYDVGTWGDEVWVALEYLGGTSLDRWVKERSRRWTDVLDVLGAAGRGLAAAHAAALVHLDVKPGNVVIADDGGVRMLDFGLARRVELDVPSTDAPSRSMVGDSGERQRRGAVGTIGYIAPELMLGEEPNALADQFEFCVMAWEALVGTRPFVGRSRREYEASVLAGRIVEPVRPRVPMRVLRVLRRGLATSPTHRWPDMDALLDALGHSRASWLARVGPPVALGSAAIVALAVLWPRTAEPPLCDGGRDEFAQVWSPSRRAAIERAFAATSEPFASSAWTTVAFAVDGYAEAWARAFDDACAVRAARKEPSDDVDRRRSACLHGQLLAVDALTGVFVTADPGVVERAGAAVRSLPQPQTCADVDRLLRPGANDEDAYSGRMAQVNALKDSHRLEPALEIARAVAADADANGAPAVAAEAYLAIGRIESLRGKVDESIAALHRAIWTAELASSDDLRADAYSELVFVAGHLAHRLADADWYAREAAEIMTRIGATSGPRSILASNRGIVLTDEGRFDQAIASYREAIDLRIAGGSGADDVFATLLNNLGSVYLARADYGAAAAWFTQAYALRVALSGPDHPLLSDVLVNQGNVLFVLGQYEPAREHYERALVIVTAAHGEDDPDLRTVHNDLAVVLAELHRDDAALEHYREALRLWRLLDPRHPMLGAVLHNIAEIIAARGDAENALALERDALVLMRAAWPDGHPYIAGVLAGIGRVELDAGHIAAAIPPLRASLDLARQLDVDPQIAGEAAFALARALASTGERALARAYGSQARRAFRDAGARTIVELAAVDAWWSAQAFDSAP